jgi:hypothetical protein
MLIKNNSVPYRRLGYCSQCACGQTDEAFFLSFLELTYTIAVCLYVSSWLCCVLKHSFGASVKSLHTCPCAYNNLTGELRDESSCSGKVVEPFQFSCRSDSWAASSISHYFALVKQMCFCFLLCSHFLFSAWQNLYPCFAHAHLLSRLGPIRKLGKYD